MRGPAAPGAAPPGGRRRPLLGIAAELEFYLKVALSCALVQRGLCALFGGRRLPFAAQVVLFWLAGSLTFYGIGAALVWLRGQAALRGRFSTRRGSPRVQPYPRFTARGLVLGELRSLLLCALILAAAPEVQRGGGFLSQVAWFLLAVVVSDFNFYVVHRLLHTRRLFFLHRKHHEFRDSSPWVAGHKSAAELLIVTFFDLLLVFVLGYDLTQLCTWVIVTGAYNLEAHSALSLFFISSDFHDLHHTAVRGNYGVQGLWDQLCGTLIQPLPRGGALFPVASLERRSLRLHERGAPR